MPTPEASAIADYLYHRGERTAIAYEDRGDIAEALDRFAAQRGADVTDRAGGYEARAQVGAPPQTGGGDAPHPIDGWTPEIMAEEARRFDEGLPAALDQFEKVTGGDAEERARDDAATLQRIVYQNECAPTCPPGHEDIKFLLRLIREDRAALRSSHREGAEAMRESCAKYAENQYHMNSFHIAIGIRALPIPGNTDAENKNAAPEGTALPQEAKKLTASRASTSRHP